MDDNLNPQQKKAIESSLGQVLVVAGAGSGKTKVLTLRYKYVIENYNYSSDEILAITFTNKAANEMKDRLSKMLSFKAFNWVGTFHNICLKILRNDIDKINRDKNFNIIDDDDQISILKDLYKLLVDDSKKKFDKSDLNTKNYPYKVILSFISKVKSNRFNKEDIYNNSNWSFLNIKTKKDCEIKFYLFDLYQKELMNNNSLDFDDLLILTNDLFRTNKEVLDKWATKFKYVLIDEFQDTNDEQYEFIKFIISKNNNLFAVGDPDQMIYSWRGANIGIINNFKKEFPNSSLIILNTNYRSTQSILNVSNELIKNNSNRIHKELIANNQSNEFKPIYFHASSQDQESRWVVNKILDLVNNNNVNLKNIAILYRSNYLSRNIENELVLNNLSYYIYGGTKFYQRKEIKDILAYIKVLYLGDDMSLKRIINVPKRNISIQSIENIFLFAKENDTSMINAIHCVNEIPNLSKYAINGVNQFIDLINSIDTNKTLVDVFDQIIEKTNYYEYLKTQEESNRIANIEELKKSIIQYQNDNPNNTFVDFLQEVSIFNNQDENNSDSISLMTIHSSKGLEFDYVFIIGLNDGIFPSIKSAEFIDSLEEERRIAYVGITRAKKQLFISSFGGYSWENTPHIPSRFINEIPKKLYEIDSEKIKSISNLSNNDWFDSTKKKDYSNNYNEVSEKFSIGDKVIHTIYGEGIVIGVNDFTIDISFKPPYNKKTIVSNHKSLKRKIVLN